ncbi:MAG: phosphoglucomutase/phosphomannomutase family protein [bacterium]
MVQDIKFGTSGYRAIISDGFTYESVKIVTQAITEHIRFRANKSQQHKVIVGYDTRFLSDEFARCSSQVLAANGVKVFLTKRDVPTPTVAYEIVKKKLDGGIIFTASHNPAQYNGIKFSAAWGGPALPETTSDIEKRARRIIKSKTVPKMMDFEQARKKGLIKQIDPRGDYMKRIAELVDIDVIKKAKLKVVVDLLYGTGRGYLDTFLKEAGCRTTVLHDWRDVLFGGSSPEPALKNLAEMLKIMKKDRYDIGLGTDGDADRFGIVDINGTFISPNEVLALLADYLITTRKLRGVVARSVMTSSFVDAVAHSHGVGVRETPVGFKYIGQILVNEDMVIGGEESGGLTIHGHVPEKDGMLACLLMAEMVAVKKKSVSAILSDLYKKVGIFISDRINLGLDEKKMEALKLSLKKNPPSKIGGLRVDELITVDGFKFVLEDKSWVGIRLSGTEPVVRVYLEANSRKNMVRLKKAAQKLLRV